MEQAAKKIVAWQINRGTLSESDRAVYQYAYELLINQTINILLAGLIAFWFKAPLAVAVFLVCYIPLRSFCGGYHANTNFGCTVVSVFILCAVCGVFNVAGAFLLKWYPVVFIFAGYMVVRYAPVHDQNKPLDSEEKMRYRVISRIIWSIEAVIGILMYWRQIQLGLVVALSHLIMAFMLGLGVFKNYKLK